MERGWILAPQETEEAFSKRKKTFEQVCLPKEKNLTVPLYDFYEIEAFILYKNDSLLPWQGAILWEYQTIEGNKYPVIQMRKNFSRFYKKEEILTHELVHALRFAFNEPFFEEMLAYQTSNQSFRRFWGPLFLYPFESMIFALALLIAPLISVFFDSFLGIWILLSTFLFLLIRLFILHVFFALCKKKLEKSGVLPEFSLAVMVRLSDKEIVETALRSSQKTLHYFEKNDKVRLQKIWHSYFRCPR